MTRRTQVITVTVEFRCPEKQRDVAVAVEAKDVQTWAEECHLCGSHVMVFVDVRKCPACGKSHDAYIRRDPLGSWGA